MQIKRQRVYSEFLNLVGGIWGGFTLFKTELAVIVLTIRSSITRDRYWFSLDDLPKGMRLALDRLYAGQQQESV